VLLSVFCNDVWTEIGDRVALSDTNQDTDPNGSRGWIIENIDIFTTTMRYGATREVATLTNGSIARLRIINMNRSDKASIMIFLRFGVDTSYQKIKLFHTAIEQFVFNRPREWVKTFTFRTTRVESDLGFIEYVIILQHRESWQNVGTILESRATVASFCLEVQKQLDMKYHSPPMPIDLNVGTTTTTTYGANETFVSDRQREQQEQQQRSSGHKNLSSSQYKRTRNSKKFKDLQHLTEIRNSSPAFGQHEIIAASSLLETKKVR
jgi:hypothetical protein